MFLGPVTMQKVSLYMVQADAQQATITLQPWE